MLIKLNNNVIIRQISKIHIKLQKIEKETQNQSKYYVFLLTTCISLFISSHLQNQMWQFTRKFVWHLIIFLWEESQVQHHLRLLLTHRKSKKEREKTHLWKQTFSIILVTTFFFFFEKYSCYNLKEGLKEKLFLIWHLSLILWTFINLNNSPFFLFHYLTVYVIYTSYLN